MNNELTVVVGPCSTNLDNAWQLDALANQQVLIDHGKMAYTTTGLRTVDAKSRTEANPRYDGMGMGYRTLHANMIRLAEGRPQSELVLEPIMEIAGGLIKRNPRLLLASEIMSPDAQLPLWARVVPDGQMMPWGASVDQLGAHALSMAIHANRHHWKLGLKNGKATDQLAAVSESPIFTRKTVAEKMWRGLQTYAGMAMNPADIIMIQRGVLALDNGNHRNIPIHNAARSVKHDNPEQQVWFDPSHSHGKWIQPQHIINAAKMTTDTGYLYDGLLVEVGDSETDSDQHIKIGDWKDIAKELIAIRGIRQEV